MPPSPSRKSTRSPLVLAREALEVGTQALPPYSSARSKHIFTQAQLFAILVLRQFLRLDYRTMSQTLADWPKMQQTLGLTTIPHYTTLQKAEQRLIKKGLFTPLLGQFGFGRDSADSAQSR